MMSKRKKQSIKKKNRALEIPLPVCRICLKTCKEKCMSLFEPYKNAAVFLHIKSITDVKIREGDGFPDKICKECLVELDISINFKEKCENSNTYLRENTSTPFYSSPLDTSHVKKEEPEDDGIDHIDNFQDISCYDNDSIVKTAEEVPSRVLDTNLSKSEQCDDKNIKTEVTLSRLSAVQCNDCNEVFRTKCKLRVHWKRVHLPQSLICDICKRVFKSLKPYKKHQEEISKKICLNKSEIMVEGTGRSRVFQCTRCDYSSLDVRAVKQHSVIHTGLRPYKCELCPKTYTQHSSMLGHMERAHDKIRVEITCQYCGKHIQGREKVYSHLQRHKEDRYQCDICKLFMKSKQYLITHLKRHSGVKSCTCEICAVSFFTTAELINHKRNVHEKIRVWSKCDLCGYKTHRKYNLLKHKAKHSDCNVACSNCGQFFDCEMKLQKHLRVHFAERKFECPLCDKKFMRKDNVYAHMKGVHNSKWMKAEKTAVQGLTVLRLGPIYD